MKNKVNKIKIAIALLFTFGAITITFSNSKTEKQLDTLMLSNIEALASGEGHLYRFCIGTGSVDCPFNEVKVDRVITGYNLEENY